MTPQEKTALLNEVIEILKGQFLKDNRDDQEMYNEAIRNAITICNQKIQSLLPKEEAIDWHQLRT